MKFYSIFVKGSVAIQYLMFCTLPALAGDRWDLSSSIVKERPIKSYDAQGFFSDMDQGQGIVKLGPSGDGQGRGRLGRTARPKVQIVVADWCSYCDRLEGFLKKQRIKYRRYNIESSSRARRLHRELGGGGVPITRIGDEVIRGYKPGEILDALDYYPDS
jgi:glutaredoxin